MLRRGSHHGTIWEKIPKSAADKEIERPVCLNPSKKCVCVCINLGSTMFCVSVSVLVGTEHKVSPLYVFLGIQMNIF